MDKSYNHDKSVIKMIQDDPEFRIEYLRAAILEKHKEGGHHALTLTISHILRALDEIV